MELGREFLSLLSRADITAGLEGKEQGQISREITNHSLSHDKFCNLYLHKTPTDNTVNELTTCF